VQPPIGAPPHERVNARVDAERRQVAPVEAGDELNGERAWRARVCRELAAHLVQPGELGR